MVVEDVSVLEEHQQYSKRIVRRRLRDTSNPLELPQSFFQKYYGVNKPAFRYLLEVLTKYTAVPVRSFAVAPVLKLSGCLHFFAEGGFQTVIGKDCGVPLSQSSVCRALTEVVDIFEEHLCPVWIKVPKSADEKREIALGFEIKHNIPGVVGCIDGTHVQVVAPSNSKHLFCNRKGNFTLNVMLMCDHELKIRYVNPSQPGSCHKSFIWDTSDLRSHFEEKYLQGETNFWLLGDAGYPLEPWLLTPYQHPIKGSPEMKFNEVHSKCRNIIERTKGMLKNRWRCLLGEKDLRYNPQKDISSDFIELNMPDEDVLQPISNQYHTAAQSIRDNIAGALFS